MNSTPYEMQSYDKAYTLKRKMQDERDWFMGQYVMSAFGTVISQAFSDSKKASYIDKPILADEKDITKAKEISDVATLTKWAIDLGADDKLPPTVFADIKAQQTT